MTHWDLAGRPFIVQNPGGNTAPTASAKHQSMSLFAEYDGASRLMALYDGDLGKTEFYRDGPGRVILRQLVNTTAGGQSSEDKISQWNTKDWLRRNALGRIGHHAYQGTADGSVLLGVEAFEQDSLGRVKAEKYESVFAPSHVLEARSSFAAGSTLRSGLDYKDSLSIQDVQLDFGRDAIGRLTEVQWDRAPGGSGMAVLAQYGWAGGIRRTRDVRYSSSSYPEGRSTFTFDAFGRLTQIQDNVYTASSTYTTKSQFDYEYDDASNLVKEKYTKVNGRVGDRFAYDAYHRLQHAWQGVDSTTMAASGNPGTYSSSSVTEQIDYDLDAANNRESTVSTTAAGTSSTPYERQDGSHPQGPSNRYASVAPPNATADVLYEYDGRGNLIYDGRFVYRYDYLNRLQQVWRVVPNDTANEENARYQPVEEGSLDEAREAVKLDVPDLYTRLLREHKDPTFRARLKATISGGVIRVTPTPQGGGADPRFLPIDGTLELAAVYVYDAFNRRVASALIGIDTYFHVWDGWRQVSEHTLHYVGSAWQATPTKQFVWGSRLDELVSYRRNVGSSWETYYLLHGGQDTAAKLVNSSGAVVEQYEYDPYGRVTVYDGSGALVDLGPSGSSPEDGTASAKGLPFLWKGIRLDEITGLLQMRNRYYSVEMGRFLTRDPLGGWWDVLNEGNECAYVGNNPLTRGDELGLQGPAVAPPPARPSPVTGVTPGWISPNGVGYPPPSPGGSPPASPGNGAPNIGEIIRQLEELGLAPRRKPKPVLVPPWWKWKPGYGWEFDPEGLPGSSGQPAPAPSPSPTPPPSPAPAPSAGGGGPGAGGPGTCDELRWRDCLPCKPPRGTILARYDAVGDPHHNKRLNKEVVPTPHYHLYRMEQSPWPGCICYPNPLNDGDAIPGAPPPEMPRVAPKPWGGGPK